MRNRLTTCMSALTFAGLLSACAGGVEPARVENYAYYAANPERYACSEDGSSCWKIVNEGSFSGRLPSDNQPVGRWIVPAGTANDQLAMDFAPGEPIVTGDQTDIDEFDRKLHNSRYTGEEKPVTWSILGPSSR